MATAPQPFKRPRRVDVERIVASGRRVSGGDCYRYATQEALVYAHAKSPRPALRVVHGILDGRIEHAWVERGGFAYDWQTLALVGKEGRPIPVAEFYKSRKARKIKVYTARQAIDWMVKMGHGGPWEAEAAYPNLTPEGATKCFAFDQAEWRRGRRRALTRPG